MFNFPSHAFDELLPHIPVCNDVHGHVYMLNCDGTQIHVGSSLT